MSSCRTCGQPVPEPCDRCGTPSLNRRIMRHRSGTPVVGWCGECYQRWLTAREFWEFEVTGVVRGVDAASLTNEEAT